MIHDLCLPSTILAKTEVYVSDIQEVYVGVVDKVSIYFWNCIYILLKKFKEGIMSLAVAIGRYVLPLLGSENPDLQLTEATMWVPKIWPYTLYRVK